jgi:redox-sensitive bicupin YhaK (pirin superfamily)
VLVFFLQYIAIISAFFSESDNIKYMSKSLFRKIPQSLMGVSGMEFCFLCKICNISYFFLLFTEPNPAWFGNVANEATNPHWSNPNWLKSRFHFSFAEYGNPHNGNFGVLRVMNDDLVQPNRGFGEHPHRDMEICTYVVQGELTHQDSMGTEETLGRGAVQFMSAGRGVYHSEHNRHLTEPLRFIQIWINTRTRGLKPNYGSFVGDAAGRRNKWQHLVGDISANFDSAAIRINQDANIFVTEIDEDQSVEFTVKDGRQAYLLCVEGNGVVEGAHGTSESLERHDAAEVYGPNSFTIRPSSGTGSAANFLLVEMAYTGQGRTDI